MNNQSSITSYKVKQFFKQMVTVKTAFDCIKTNKQMETQEWVFLVIFRSRESFVDPLAKEKLTWNADGWLAPQGCPTSPCPMPVLAILCLLTLCYPGAGVNTSTQKPVLWATSVLGRGVGVGAIWVKK